MSKTFTFSTTDERLNKTRNLVSNDKNRYPDVSFVINLSLDQFFKNMNTNKIIDLMYFVSIPLLFFLVCIGITLFTASLFFYILTGLSGIYLMIFGFLWFNKYRGS